MSLIQTEIVQITPQEKIDLGTSLQNIITLIKNDITNS